MKRSISRLLNLFYAIMISSVVNYIVYSLQIAIVLSIVPMLLAIFLFLQYMKKSEEKLWQYLCTIPMVVISFLFYSSMYIRGIHLFFVAAVLSFILAVWSVLCIENKIAINKGAKGAILSVAAFILIYLAGGSLIWFHYNEEAAAAIDYLLANADVSQLEDYEGFIQSAASETDGLCHEIDKVLYASDKIYSLSDLAYGYCYWDESYRDEYSELLRKLDNSDFNKIRLLLDNIPLMNWRFN